MKTSQSNNVYAWRAKRIVSNINSISYSLVLEPRYYTLHVRKRDWKRDHVRSYVSYILYTAITGFDIHM